MNIEDLEINDYVEYLSEVKKVAIYPNNDIEEVAEILENCGFSISDILYNSKNYHKADDVLWVYGLRFGSWAWWELEEQFGDEVVAWLKSRQ